MLLLFSWQLCLSMEMVSFVIYVLILKIQFKRCQHHVNKLQGHLLQRLISDSGTFLFSVFGYEITNQEKLAKNALKSIKERRMRRWRDEQWPNRTMWTWQISASLLPASLEWTGDRLCVSRRLANATVIAVPWRGVSVRG